MNDQLKPCVACDCVDDVQYYSPCGAGPFCGDCWQSLTDADQALLLEKRLEASEKRIEEQDAEIARLKAKDKLNDAIWRDHNEQISKQRQELNDEIKRLKNDRSEMADYLKALLLPENHHATSVCVQEDIKHLLKEIGEKL